MKYACVLMLVCSLAVALIMPRTLIAAQDNADVNALLKALKGGGAEQRAQAAKSLGECDNHAKEVVRSLIKALNDKDPRVRAEAAEALGHQREPEGVSPLIIILTTDPEKTVRKAAAFGLQCIGPKAEPAVPALIETLKRARPPKVSEIEQFNDNYGFLSTRVALALAGIGPPSAKPLAAMLIDRALPNFPREAATYALTLMDKKAAGALPIVVKALDDPDEDIRMEVVSILEAIGSETPGVHESLLRALRDNYPKVRAYAAGVLHRLELEKEASLRTLLEVVRLKDSKARSAAAYELKAFGPAAAPAVPDLIEALADKASYTRENAAEVLAAIGPAARAAVLALRKALNDPSIDVRYEADEALVKIQGYPSYAAPETEQPSRAGRACAASKRAVRDAPVRLTVIVPEDAVVWIDGKRTRQTGEVREFESPPIGPGKIYTYEIRYRRGNYEGWAMGTENIIVHAGEHITVDFKNKNEQERERIELEIR